MLLCPVAPDIGCGTCSACQRVVKQLHPDLHILAPLPGKREIGIDAIRDDLIPAVSLAPFEAKRKVFIVVKADWMTEEAADCLLKTLEEPPPSSVLLLLTESADLLQPTIRSRCQTVRLPCPSPDEVAQELATRFGLPADQALALAQLCDGNMGRAAAMQETGWQAGRDTMLRALSGASPEALAAMREHIDKEREKAASSGRSLEAQRIAIRQKLLLLLLCCRDMLVGSLTQNRDLLFNRDAADHILQAGATSPTPWQYLAEELLQADDAVLANVNLGLLLDFLMQRFRRLSEI
jgi:DNA polymerase-3 subunit delta'